MRFVIRDDDLNYFVKPEYIDQWYGDIFEQKIPVGFATIPFVLPLEKSLYFEHQNVELREYPIYENTELVEYLKNNQFIEILQHGYNHEVKNRKYEYGNGAKPEELIEKTLKGKETLKKTFEREIKIFVPPHDRISNQGILAVETAGMNIIRGIGSKNFLFRSQYFKAIGKMAFHRLKFPNKQKTPAYPFVIDFGKHKEAYSNRLNEDNLEDLIRRLKFCYEVNGNFIVTLHLYAFNQKIKDNLMFLIKMAKELKAEFVYPSNLFE
jgi:hypothetical protein